MSTSTNEREPLDVWLRFHPDDDEQSEYEANCYAVEGGGVVVEWYHVDVGQVTQRLFNDHAAARKWLEDAGYQDFSS